jgi:hypothetical protein
MFSTHVSNIQKALKDNGFTLSTYVEKVLESLEGTLEQWESLISNAQPICAALCSIDTSGVFGMMVLMVSERLSTEILGLSQVGGGLHFNANTVYQNTLKAHLRRRLHRQYRKCSIYLIQQLLNANPSWCQIHSEACDLEVMDEEILAEFECDLGDIEM